MSEKNRTQEERIEKIKNLLSQKNGKIDDELKNEILKITTQKRNEKANDVIKDLSSANSFDSNEIAQELGNIEPPDVVKESIRKTLSSIVDPIRTTFMAEVPKYVDAISTEREVDKIIPRTVKTKTIKKIENGKFVPAGGEELVINPEFKRLLSTGYKPADVQEYEKKVKDISGGDPEADDNPLIDFLIATQNPEIGTSDSDYIKNYIGGEEPGKRTEKITNTVNIPAGIFIKSFEDIENNVRYVSQLGSKEIKMEGNIYKTQKLNSLKTTETTDIPDWKISYREKSKKYYLDIKNNFEYLYNNKITVNTSSYSFIGNLDTALTQEEKDYLNSVNLAECEEFDNDELYSYLMFRKFSNAFERTLSDTEATQVRDKLKEKHTPLIENIISSFMSVYIKNRLLSPFKLTKIEGLEDADLEKTNLIILNLLNFIPEASEELKACGKQPHPLNLDSTIDLMTKKFNQVGLQVIPKKEYCADISLGAPKNPITEATAIGVVLMTTRIVIFENILKSLFVLDTHKYAYELLDSGLLIDFMYIKVLENLKKYNILEQFEEIVEENYDFLKQNNLITQEDEENISTVISSYLNQEKLQNENKQLKILIKSLTRKTIGYTKKLIGVSGDIDKTSILSSITNNKIYDLPELYFDRTTLTSTKEETRRRVTRINKEKTENSTDFFILERYVDVQDLYNTTNWSVSSQLSSIKLRYPNINGCIRFEDYQQFLNSFIENDLPNLTIRESVRPIIDNIVKKLDYFLKKPRLGIRLVQVSERRKMSFGSLPIAISRSSIDTQLKNVLNISNTNISFDLDKIKYKKMYSFFDIDYNSEKVVYYNSFPVVEKEVLINYDKIYNLTQQKINNFEQQVYDKEKDNILKNITLDSLYNLLLNKCFMTNKIPNLALFYSNSALSTSAMENLFTSSKNKILDLYDSAVNIKNYKHKNSIERSGGTTAKYKQDLDNVGNPSGGFNFDILQFFITTPILILKGITQLMDPNIAIASQIVNAASAGLLFPRIENNTPVYPGQKVILPTALASMALLPVNLLPPGLGIGPPVTPLPGMLYWALEPLLWKLPFFQNQAANSDEAKKLKDDPQYGGLKIGDPDNFKCDVDQDE